MWVQVLWEAGLQDSLTHTALHFFWEQDKHLVCLLGWLFCCCFALLCVWFSFCFPTLDSLWKKKQRLYTQNYIVLGCEKGTGCKQKLKWLGRDAVKYAVQWYLKQLVIYLFWMTATTRRDYLLKEWLSGLEGWFEYLAPMCRGSPPPSLQFQRIPCFLAATHMWHTFTQRVTASPGLLG